MTQDPSPLEDLPAGRLLSDFSDEEQRILGSYGKILVFKQGDTVIREGQTQESLYFLAHGLLHAVHEVEDGSTPLGAIGPGEWFGEINIFDPHAASATVVASHESRVWRMSRSRLEEFLNDHPELGCQLLLSVGEVLSRRARQLVAKLNATWELSW